MTLVVWHAARRAAPGGTVALSYAVGYGLARFAVEFFRGDPPMVAGIVVPQAISVLLVVAGLATWWFRRPPLFVDPARAA